MIKRAIENSIYLYYKKKSSKDKDLLTHFSYFFVISLQKKTCKVQRFKNNPVKPCNISILSLQHIKAHLGAYSMKSKKS